MIKNHYFCNSCQKFWMNVEKKKKKKENILEIPITLFRSQKAWEERTNVVHIVLCKTKYWLLHNGKAAAYWEILDNIQLSHKHFCLTQLIWFGYWFQLQFSQIETFSYDPRSDCSTPCKRPNWFLRVWNQKHSVLWTSVNRFKCTEIVSCKPNYYFQEYLS